MCITSVRLHVGTNNPHLATRRVASDLDAAIEYMSMIRAGVKTAPLMLDYLAELEDQQRSAKQLLDMMTDEGQLHLKDIDDMLENELAEEEDTTVAAMLMKGYGHDDESRTANVEAVPFDEQVSSDDESDEAAPDDE